LLFPILREKKLRVTETEGQRSQRNHYKYEQLHDLQSRLMLVAGKAEKGKANIKRKKNYDQDHHYDI
jgi:hypothetical protein